LNDGARERIADDRLPGRRARGLLPWLRPRAPGLARLYALTKTGFAFHPGPSDGTPMTRARAMSRRALFAARPIWTRRAARAVATLSWPLAALIGCLRWHPVIPRAERAARPGAWRRIGDMYRLALTCNVPPREYVAYRLYRPEIRDRAGAFLYVPEQQALLAALAHETGADPDAVDDKARFARLCRQARLPAIPTLAAFRAGQQVEPRVEPAPPWRPAESRLRVKDLCGSQGSGAAVWISEDGAYRNAATGAVLSPDELVACWRRRDTIVQPLLANHPALTPWSDDGLVDLRLITGMTRDGEVLLIAAMAILPAAATIGYDIFAAIDPASGCLERPMLAGTVAMARHPASDALLEDTPLPCWHEATSLVLRAHAAVPEFARFVFLGWDVAVTPEGPVLIEANAGWSSYTLQSGTGIPIGHTRFADVALQYDATRMARAACA